ncbi:MAG: helix-turn-helix transcriptional regulator [Gemmatimonadota bacterium]
MGESFAGEFEQMILLAVARLGPGAYGWSVARELEEVAGRAVSSGALYTTLNRLESKGWLTGRLEEGGEERGGRPRRYLTLTPAGATAVRRAREAMDCLWAGLDLRPGEAR